MLYLGKSACSLQAVQVAAKVLKCPLLSIGAVQMHEGHHDGRQWMTESRHSGVEGRKKMKKRHFILAEEGHK
jgi:hypothetical protein